MEHNVERTTIFNGEVKLEDGTVEESANLVTVMFETVGDIPGMKELVQSLYDSLKKNGGKLQPFLRGADHAASRGKIYGLGLIPGQTVLFQEYL